MSAENHVCRVRRRLTVCVCRQESKWSLFKRKLKPGTTFENPSYSEVSLDIFKTPVTRQRVQVFFQLADPVRCSADEGWKACGKQWGLFCPWAISVCPPRQTSEEGSPEHLLANRGQFQRHGQPRERGQRRITPLSQTGIATNKETHFAQNLFFYAACVQNSKLF